MPKGYRTSARDWLPLIESWKSSGLNKKAFCTQQGIAYKSFMKWYKQLIQPKSLKTTVVNPLNNTAEPLFIPIGLQMVEPSATLKSSGPLILVLNSKVQLQTPVEAINSHLFSLLFKALGV